MKWFRVFSNENEARQRLEESKPQLVVIEGKRICLVRRNDEFFAVQDACTHNSDSLSKGTVNFLGEVICPWHHYRFDLRTGRASDSSCRDLQVFSIRIDTEGFFIGV